MTRVLLAYLPALVWAALLLFVGGQSDISVPRLPIPMRDKVMHFVAYGILGALAAWGRQASGWRPARVWPLLLVLLSVGACDELHQATIPERDAEFGDWVADSLGVLLAFGIVTRWYAGKRREERG